jgi:hypothetical protein
MEETAHLTLEAALEAATWSIAMNRYKMGHLGH